MSGGIQNGTVATDKVAKKIDQDCRKARDFVFKTLKEIYPELVMKKKIASDDIAGGVGSMQADGGSFFYGKKLIAVFEAKKQQNRGNAIERWYKNHDIARSISPDVSYVTFTVGAGAAVGAVIWKTLHHQHHGARGGFDSYHAGKNSCFMSSQGFEYQFIEDTMMKVIRERVEHHLDTK